MLWLGCLEGIDNTARPLTCGAQQVCVNLRWWNAAFVIFFNIHTINAITSVCKIKICCLPAIIVCCSVIPVPANIFLKVPCFSKHFDVFCRHRCDIN